MTALIYDKTDKGREEIATRKYQLPSRLRTLLVMVDGKQTVPDLLKKVGGLGLDAQSIQELLDQELIGALVLTAPAEPSETGIQLASPEQAIDADAIPVEFDEARRFQLLYNFFNETIKSAIGLRGYALQLKVERAANLEDFKQLRQPYLEAVLKIKGREMARSLRDRLDQLLYAGELSPPDTFLKTE